MKQLFLLLTAGVFAISTQAQEHNVGESVRAVPFDHAKMREMVTHEADYKSAHKTTSVTDRWYNYGDLLHRQAAMNASLGLTNDSIVSITPFFWQDDRSTNIDMATMSLDTNKLVSVGCVLHPQWSGFNNPSYYTPFTTMALTNTDAYLIDTIIVQGIYGTNPARIVHVDTLSIVLVSETYGPKTAHDVWAESLTATHWSTGSITMPNMFYDSANNRGNTWFTPLFLLKVPMSVGDTLADGSYFKKIPLKVYGPGDLTCPANSIVGATISFISGDASFVPYDTVCRDTSVLYKYKYNSFKPLLDYITTGGTTTEWPLYNAADLNVGLFKTLPDTAFGWGSKYIPEYKFTDPVTAGPSTWQNPYLWMHVTCPACTHVVMLPVPGSVNNMREVSEISAIPNPAADELNISFSLSQAGSVSVSLTNMIGQTVARQWIIDTNKGSVVFNTSNLPTGVYIYNIEANGERSTGRVVIAH